MTATSIVDPNQVIRPVATLRILHLTTVVASRVSTSGRIALHSGESLGALRLRERSDGRSFFANNVPRPRVETPTLTVVLNERNCNLMLVGAVHT